MGENDMKMGGSKLMFQIYKQIRIYWNSFFEP